MRGGRLAPGRGVPFAPWSAPQARVAYTASLTMCTMYVSSRRSVPLLCSLASWSGQAPRDSGGPPAESRLPFCPRHDCVPGGRQALSTPVHGKSSVKARHRHVSLARCVPFHGTPVAPLRGGAEGGEVPLVVRGGLCARASKYSRATCKLKHHSLYNTAPQFYLLV